MLSFERGERNGAQVSTATCDPGGGALTSCDHFGPTGDDSAPLATDYVVGVDVQRTGASAVVAYVDPINAPLTSPGDKRIYSRDADGGEAVADVWLKNDGTIVLANANGGLTLAADGSVTINGVVISPDGLVDVPTSLTLAGKEISGHTHPAGSPPGNTGANN